MDAEVFAELLADVSAGEAIRNSLAARSVNPRVFYGFLARDDEAAKRYARAREAGLCRMSDRIEEIADDAELDPNDKRVRIDARKWLLTKLMPKVYGDRVDMNHGGSVNVILSPADVGAL